MSTRDGMTLAEQTARRLILAGISPDDPALKRIRAWNTRALERAAAALSGNQGDGK